MRTFNDTFATGIDLSAATYTSPVMPLKNIYGFSIAMNISAGAPVGTLKLQVSNDPETNDTMPNGIPRPVPTNFADLTGTSISVIASDTTVMFNVHDVGYTYVRVVYTRTSGTGTASLVINARGF